MSKEKDIKTPDIGVALYRIKCNGSLHGKWTVANAKENPEGSSTGKLGIEIATPQTPKQKGLEGKYDVNIFFDNRNIFSGDLVLKKLTDNSYEMSWIQDDIVMYKGYGVRRRRNLAANYWKLKNESK